MYQIKQIIKSYEAWVSANPETVCDLETTSKFVSYFIAGRISDSNIVSELVYSLSNLMELYHDRILAPKSLDDAPLYDGPGTSRQRRTQSHENSLTTNDNNGSDKRKMCYRLKIMLTTLEYCEVFIEISAKRAFGVRGKWIFIVLLQFAKAAGRFFILTNSTEQIITSPVMPSLNRRALIKKQKTLTKNPSRSSNGIVAAAAPEYSHSGSNKITKTTTTTKGDEHSITFQLKRSGRLVRKVEGAPPLQYRDFKLLGEDDGRSESANLPLPFLRAEYIYIAKPLIHLAAMGVFGEKRWKQYFIALALDFASIRLYHKHRHLMSKQQRLEMSRRCINILLYLMRSPFYERFTQSRVERALNFVADNVPLLRLVAGPIREYVPHWQSTYFYLWSA